jgi:hypothetical protein
MTGRPTTQTPPERPPEPRTFDVRVTDDVKAAFDVILRQYPEVQCLSCSVCWAGALNDATIGHGVWVTRDPRNPSLSEILGSAAQAIKLVYSHLAAAERRYADIVNGLADMSEEIRQKHEEIERLNKEIEAKKG